MLLFTKAYLNVKLKDCKIFFYLSEGFESIHMNEETSWQLKGHIWYPLEYRLSVRILFYLTQLICLDKKNLTVL